MPQKDDIYDTGNGVMGAGMSWNDKHRPGCYVNVWRGGLVLGTSKRLATEYQTQKPLYWKKDRGEDDLSRPQKMTLLITVLADGSTGALDERDPQDPTDAGIRTIWLTQRGRSKQVNGQWVPDDNDWAAHCTAMEEAGFAKMLPEEGGIYFHMQTGSQPGRGDVDRKTWTANYRPPTPESLAHFERVTRQAVTPTQDDIYVQPNGNGQPQQEAPRWQGSGQSQQPAYAQAPQQPAPPTPPPSYAGAPAASNQPQWGPRGGPQEQQASAPQAPQYVQTPPRQAPPAAPPQQPPAPPQYAGAPY